MRWCFFLSLFLSALLAGNPSSAQNTCTLNTFDNNIEVVPARDTLKIQDPVTGAWSTITQKRKLPQVSYRDGKKIYKAKEASEPIGKATQKDIQGYFRELFAEELYRTKEIFDFMVIVIDENGRPAAFETNFLIFPSEKVAPERKAMLEKLKDITIIPAKKNGKAVPYLIIIER